MASRTASSRPPGRSAAGRWSVVAGVLGVIVLPVAIVATRWSAAYDLTQSGFAIVPAAILAAVALVLSGRARRAVPLSVQPAPVDGAARLGRALGVLGLALAASGGLALVVYGVLTYLGERGG